MPSKDGRAYSYSHSGLVWICSMVEQIHTPILAILAQIDFALQYRSSTSNPNRDSKSEFQAATACKICPFDCLNFPPCICILLFYASWQEIRILVLFSWRKNARCSVVLLSIRKTCHSRVSLGRDLPVNATHMSLCCAFLKRFSVSIQRTIETTYGASAHGNRSK